MVGGRVGSGSTCKIEIDYEVCSHFFHTDNANRGCPFRGMPWGKVVQQYSEGHLKVRNRAIRKAG